MLVCGSVQLLALGPYSVCSQGGVAAHRTNEMERDYHFIAITIVIIITTITITIIIVITSTIIVIITTITIIILLLLLLIIITIIALHPRVLCRAPGSEPHALDDFRVDPDYLRRSDGQVLWVQRLFKQADKQPTEKELPEKVLNLKSRSCFVC